jgi:hypothetical protein
MPITVKDDGPTVDPSEESLDDAKRDESARVDAHLDDLVGLDPFVDCDAGQKPRVQRQEGRPGRTSKRRSSDVLRAFGDDRLVGREARDVGLDHVHVGVLENVNLPVSQSKTVDGKAHVKRNGPS